MDESEQERKKIRSDALSINQEQTVCAEVSWRNKRMQLTNYCDAHTSTRGSLLRAFHLPSYRRTDTSLFETCIHATRGCSGSSFFEQDQPSKEMEITIIINDCIEPKKSFDFGWSDKHLRPRPAPFTVAL